VAAVGAEVVHLALAAQEQEMVGTVRLQPAQHHSVQAAVVVVLIPAHEMVATARPEL
jgi:hypothetical protein